MKMPSNKWSLIGLTFALAACDQPRSSGKPMGVEANGKASAEQDIARTEDSVRLSLAEKRIAELQLKLAEMGATPESVEIELLKSRLDAVEAKAYARQDDPALPVDSVPATRPSTRPVTPPPQTGARAATVPAKRDGGRTPLRLREMESSTRPATDAEKTAFSKPPQ